MLINALVAAVIGLLSIQTREIYFVFLTFAFAQFFYHAVNGWEWVGAANGLPGIPAPAVAPGLELADRRAYYYFALGLLVAGLLIARRVVRSAFGHVLVAIRENEERARCLGYDVPRCLRRAFVLSGVFAGVGGGLMAMYQSFVAPTVYHWSVSGEILLMELLGGMGTLVGPMFGAAFVIVLGDVLSSWMAERWGLVMGLIYAACVLFSPTGLAGIVSTLRPWQIFRLGARLVPQGRGIFPRLSVEENLRLATLRAAVADPAAELDRVFELFPVLRERRRQRGETLSGGELQMLAIARALLGTPELILMDEPTEGLAPLVVQSIQEVLRGIKRQGITVVLAEQNVRMALEVGDWRYIIGDGQIRFAGDSRTIRDNEEVKAAYLGVSKR